MKNVSRWILAVAVLALGAGACYAPIEDKPEGKAFHRELTDDELSKYQTSDLTATPTAEKGFDSDPKVTSTARGEDEATKTLQSMQPANEGAAVLSLEQANKDLKKAKSGNDGISPLFLGGIFVVIGLGVLLGLRTYLDKNVPDGPTPYKPGR